MRRALRGLTLGLALALALLAAPGWSAEDRPESPVANPAESMAQRLKVVYLYNFTRYVHWPAAALGDAFVIAVLGDPALAEALRVLERPDQQAAGRPIRIRALDGTGDLDPAQILFVGAGAVADLPRILTRTGGKPILLVGDSPGLARRGVAINFFLKPDILGEGLRLRFQINPDALAGRGLEVMADLYDVAEIVR